MYSSYHALSVQFDHVNRIIITLHRQFMGTSYHDTKIIDPTYLVLADSYNHITPMHVYKKQCLGWKNLARSMQH